MKVFISWSGNKSHKVAMVFREWLPSVIQTIEPYVSSEDIDKGARWSTDIAKELANSTFGILCVTKGNLHAPWLSFEAGALSKTVEKTYVTPFLFDIKRAEVDGPILQFQSTIFEKEDIKKLIHTLNKACGESGITESMLDKAFDVWYPTLENQLNELKNISDNEEDNTGNEAEEQQTSTMIEKILELSQDNQKLLRNPDTKVSSSIESMKSRLDEVLRFIERSSHVRRNGNRNNVRFQYTLLQELLPNCDRENAFLVLLSVFKEEFPWIYNLGMDLLDNYKNSNNVNFLQKQIENFKHVLEYTCEHPYMRDRMDYDESYMLIREMQYQLYSVIRDMEEELLTKSSERRNSKRKNNGE